MKKFSKEDLSDYIRKRFKTEKYSDYMMNITGYVYTIRIPAIVTKKEVISEDGKILREERYPESQENRVKLDILKFGFKSNRKLQEKEVVDKFMKTFEDVEKKGYAVGVEEPLDENEDTLLIRRTYIKEFIPVDIMESSRCYIPINPKKKKKVGENDIDTC